MAVSIKRNTSSTSKAKKTIDDLVNVQLDVETLNTMCKFVISDSIYIKRYDLIQLRRFLNVVDTNKVINASIDQADRLLFLKYALDAKLELRMVSQDAVLGYISSKFDKPIDFIDKNSLLSREDIYWVNATTSEILKFAFMYKEVENLRNLCNEFSQTNIGHRGDIIPKFETEIDKIKNEFRKLKAEDENEQMFSLRPERFESMIVDTYNKAKSPSRRLWCGMQGVNQLTGGFESGRVYMLFGSTGVGKSVTLLNLMYQIRQYNRNYLLKDPTKTPCIVMLTMENTMGESILRLFDLVNSTNMSMEQYESPDEVMNILRQQGQLALTDDNPIDIVIKYKPNRSVATDYLYTLYDELEDSGYEPICFIQDHIKRIRPVDDDRDLRLALGNTVNEFKVFASLKDIPVITDSHLNRDGAATIESGAASSKADITRMLGAKNVGESLLMLDNLDMGIIINKEWDRDGNMYMVFSVIKKRVRNIRDYVAQPFVMGSEIRLVEDVNARIPAFKESLRSMGNLVRNDNTIRASAYSNIIDTNDVFTSDDTNIFDPNNSYSSDDFGTDFTPLTSDIPDYSKVTTPSENVEKEPKKEKINPIIMYNLPNDPQSLLDDLKSVLAG